MPKITYVAHDGTETVVDVAQNDTVMRGAVLASRLYESSARIKAADMPLLGIESEITRIRHDGRCTRLGIYPIGINARKFEQELNTPEHRAQCDPWAIRRMYSEPAWREPSEADSLSQAFGLEHAQDALRDLTRTVVRKGPDRTRTLLNEYSCVMNFVSFETATGTPATIRGAGRPASAAACRIIGAAVSDR